MKRFRFLTRAFFTFNLDSGLPLKRTKMAKRVAPPPPLKKFQSFRETIRHLDEAQVSFYFFLIYKKIFNKLFSFYFKIWNVKITKLLRRSTRTLRFCRCLMTSWIRWNKQRQKRTSWKTPYSFWRRRWWLSNKSIKGATRTRLPARKKSVHCRNSCRRWRRS